MKLTDSEELELAALILQWDAVDITPEGLERIEALELKRDTSSASLQIISLGAGVQSTTMALMSAHGELPMAKCAIFADTGDEPKAVYDHLIWLESVLPFPVFRVRAKGDLMQDNIRVRRSAKSGKLYLNGKIPAFVLNPNGTRGLLGRKCTAEYKIEPIHRKARELVPEYTLWRKRHRDAISAVALAIKQKLPCPLDEWNAMQDDAPVDMWIGISTDEAGRAKPSRKPWIRNTWPLLHRRISREGCEKWLAGHGYPEAPRSACKKCPFHSDYEWESQTPEDFAESVQYELDMQAAAASQEALVGIPFLHETCVSLDQVDFAARRVGRQQVGQFQNECEGLCGV